MTELLEKKCVPCRGDEPPLEAGQIEELSKQVPEWNLIEKDGIPRLQRTYKFDNFAQALAFTQKVGEEAEEQGHHPALKTEWGRVTVTWWTHKIKGLHENDFVMAAKSDKLYA